MQVRNFSKTGDAIKIPNLAELQIAGYRRFLQPDCLPEEREPIGLEGLFLEFFPITGPDGVLRMEYLGYELGAPLREEAECRRLGLTYAFPVRVRLRIVGPETVEEDVYLADLPKMVGSGAGIVNGAERVIVAQIQRSPGVDFSEVVERAERKAPSCRFVPERGPWIEFTVSRRDTLEVRLGQSGRMPATWLLRAMLPEVESDADLLALFHEREKLDLTAGDGLRAVAGRFLAGDVVDRDTGEMIGAAGTRVSRELAQSMLSSGMKTVVVLKNVDDPLLVHTLVADPCKSHAAALLRIYGRFRPGEPATVERAAQFFAERFANPRRYNLGKVGRFRINRKFAQNVQLDRLTLCPEDILNAIRYLMRLRQGEGSVDDIDDLGNRVLRPIDKLLEDALRAGMARWCRSIRDQLVTREGRVPSPRTVAATRAIATTIEHFFSRSELSQVADQTNPLAALNHIRRISALGPGGLNRKRAGFEVRDVHASHYGRICPIETPEGPNIGLIASLGIFAKVDEYGFITTPYRRIGAEQQPAAPEAAGLAGDTRSNGELHNGDTHAACRRSRPGSQASRPEIRYLRADEEKGLRLAPAGLFACNNDHALARWADEFAEVKPTDVDWMDVSPKQLVGVSASLIPFLEHNDANRALMGSNMQRQAVPLMQTEQAVVATGMEGLVAADSGMVVVARAQGTVTEVDASHIRIGEALYPLAKYERLNEDTCLNQKPIVQEGQHVTAGQVIADGAATCMGELSLGRNVLVAFMMWDGYNFEDAIIVSDSLVQSDKYTSVHIQEFTAELRETRLGREEFTRDIPHVAEHMLANLDEHGIVRVGTKVDAGDILVGKVAPKSKTDLTPEERLLREIFGKAGIDVTNECLTVPHGSSGAVVDVRHYRRKTHLPDAERSEGRRKAKKARAEYDGKIAAAFQSMIQQLSDVPRLGGFSLPAVPESAAVRELLHHEQSFRFDLKMFASDTCERAKRIFLAHRNRISELKAKRDQILRQLRVGDELPHGVLEMVKVYIAVKRPLATGDKLAGRHGNKGVIARIVPQSDMPFLPDGTPVEILLNPLGVPSRMNVGQILETHLGWAGRVLGFRAVTPVFDGATEKEIRACLREAGLPEDGKTVLYDGRTGEPFDQEVTIGHIYLMKLNHLVDDKIHARATGPYSLITQQPLGGKARMGGQRLGEMEVWAIEAYGAAHVLQEMLTVKSDDVEGRSRMYESIIKGRNVLEPGTPISLDVLVHEMRGLGLSLQFDKAPGNEQSPARRAPVQSHDVIVPQTAERR